MYKKITKMKARLLYQQHKDFIMVPNNMPPNSILSANITANSFERMADVDFDQMVNTFRYYNCGNRETGKAVSFYVEVTE